MNEYDGIIVYGGDIVSADDINANTPKTYVKTLATARTSTTTYANDDELVNIPLEAGTYAIRLDLFFTAANTTPKLKTQWAYTGSWNSPVRFCMGSSASSGAPGAAADMYTSGAAADSQDTAYNTSGTAAYTTVFELSNEVICTSAGNLSLRYAQVVSNAGAVTLRPGTSFTVRKISD